MLFNIFSFIINTLLWLKSKEYKKTSIGDTKAIFLFKSNSYTFYK